MRETSNRLIYWTPRILCILFAAFLSIFALDAFDTPGGLPQVILAFATHMIPTALVLIGLAIVWRHEWIGTIIFPLLAVVHFAMMGGRLHWSAYVVIEGPLLFMGVLFLLSWRNRTALKAST